MQIGKTKYGCAPLSRAGANTATTLLLALVLLLPCPVFAQSAAFQEKAGVLLKMQVQAWQEQHKAGSTESVPGSEMAGLFAPQGVADIDAGPPYVFVYFAEEPTAAQLQELADKGIKVFPETWVPPLPNHPNGFLLAKVPMEQLDGLAVRPDVRRLTSGDRKRSPQNNEAAVYSAADTVWTTGPGYDGDGIVIAVLDSGLNLDAADIPAPIYSVDCHDPDNLDDDIANTVTQHGTHVTGTALGLGTESAGTFKGAAYGAGLMFYKIGGDVSSSASDAAIIYAIGDAVTREGGADIITMSYGGWGQYNDGSDASSQAVDNAVANGVAVFLSAGNSADDEHHYSGTVPASSSTDYIQVNVTGAGPNIHLYFDLVWYDGLGTSNDLTLEYYNHEYTKLTDVTVDDRSESSRGTESQVSEYDNTVPLGSSTYYLKVVNNSAVSQTFHIFYWTYLNGNLGSVAFQNPDEASTLGCPACADDSIAVGSWNSRYDWTNHLGVTYNFTTATPLDSLSVFSSQGPRIDGGAEKPNIVAPGSAIISVRDRDVSATTELVICNDYYTSPTCDDADADYYVMQGTSMATPHAAGVGALLMEAIPSLQGDPAALRTALQENAANAGVYDDATGYGLIDAYATLVATPVTLVDLRAEYAGRQVLLQWETATEADCAGFHAWRSASEADGYERLTEELIAAEGTPVQGAVYSWTDKYAPATGTCCYKLEEVSTSGLSTFHGPVCVESALPLPCGASGSMVGVNHAAWLLLPLGALLWLRRASRGHKGLHR